MKRIFFLTVSVLFSQLIISQCMSIPVTLEKRVQSSPWIVLGKVKEKHTYEDDKGNIYALNQIDVSAWVKNYRNQSTLFIITLGGVLNNKAQVTFPAVQLIPGNEYVFFLEGDNQAIDDNAYRALYPDMIQSLTYADAQGALLYQKGKYHDVLSHRQMTEEQLLQQLKILTGQQPRMPDGTLFVARTFSPSSILAVTSFSPDPTNAGTIDPADFLTITGSGFGGTPGTVQFANADDGGATDVTPPIGTDYVSWSDGSITVKVTREAGTGPFTVNGTLTSPTPLTIGYSHYTINSSSSGFAAVTRQRYYLRNINGLGGYSFLYNSTSGLSANAPAVAAIERALSTWRYPDKINWRSAGTTTKVFASDSTSVILFDASLPAGTLGRASSRFNGGASGACDMFNTVWWLSEIDLQFIPDPPDVGFTWQYGPALATSSQYDFESVALHELGHAYGLLHRIAPGELMNYSISNGDNIRTPAAIERTGTDVKLAYSITPTCFNPAGSGTPMIPWDGSNPLPVILLSFAGVCNNYGTELTWKTSLEENTNRFEIEKSPDARNFQSIGYLNTQQTSSQIKSYHYVDKAARNWSSFYRLKMIDNDGSFAYSDIIKIDCNKKSNTLTVSPNPVKHSVFIESIGLKELRLINIHGQLLKNISVHNGRNEIDLSYLPDGMYVLYDVGTKTKSKIILIK